MLEELDLQNMRELEDLVIQSIENSLLLAKINQNDQRIIVESVFGRDATVKDVDGFLDIMAKWKNKTEKMVLLLDEKIDNIKTQVKQSEEMEEDRKIQFDEAVNKYTKENPDKVEEGSSEMKIDYREHSDERKSKRPARTRLGIGRR